MTIVVSSRIWERCCLSKTCPQKTRHLSWYVGVFIYINESSYFWTSPAKLIVVLCPSAARLLVQRKQGQTSEVSLRSLPVLFFFFLLVFSPSTQVFFMRKKTDPYPLHYPNPIICSTPPPTSQIKAAMEAGQPFEDEIKSIWDASVDKTLVSFFCWSYYF